MRLGMMNLKAPILARRSEAYQTVESSTVLYGTTKQHSQNKKYVKLFVLVALLLGALQGAQRGLRGALQGAPLEFVSHTIL